MVSNFNRKKSKNKSLIEYIDRVGAITIQNDELDLETKTT